MYWFVIIITILSNIASNVPVCQMLAATFPYATPYDWLQVSFSATIAGNLTMLGSAANMIVAFQAAKVATTRLALQDAAIAVPHDQHAASVRPYGRAQTKHQRYRDNQTLHTVILCYWITVTHESAALSNICGEFPQTSPGFHGGEARQS